MSRSEHDDMLCYIRSTEKYLARIREMLENFGSNQCLPNLINIFKDVSQNKYQNLISHLVQQDLTIDDLFYVIGPTPKNVELYQTLMINKQQQKQSRRGHDRDVSFPQMIRGNRLLTKASVNKHQCHRSVDSDEESLNNFSPFEEEQQYRRHLRNLNTHEQNLTEDENRFRARQPEAPEQQKYKRILRNMQEQINMLSRGDSGKQNAPDQMLYSMPNPNHSYKLDSNLWYQDQIDVNSQYASQVPPLNPKLTCSGVETNRFCRRYNLNDLPGRACKPSSFSDKNLERMELLENQINTDTHVAEKLVFKSAPNGRGNLHPAAYIEGSGDSAKQIRCVPNQILESTESLADAADQDKTQTTCLDEREKSRPMASNELDQNDDSKINKSSQPDRVFP